MQTAESEKSKTFRVFFLHKNFLDKTRKSDEKKIILWQFLDYLDSFWIVRKVARLSGQYLDCPDSF